MRELFLSVMMFFLLLGWAASDYSAKRAGLVLQIGHSTHQNLSQAFSRELQ